MIVLQRPIIHPHVCICCSIGDERRDWYVDLGLALDNHFNPLYDGAIYYCNLCWDDLVRRVGIEVQKFNPVGIEDTQTYDNTEPLMETLEIKQETYNDGLPRFAGTPEGLPDSDAAGTPDDSAVDDQSAESSDSQLEFGDSGTSESSDDEPELASFRGFFGREGGSS